MGAVTEAIREPFGFLSLIEKKLYATDWYPISNEKLMYSPVRASYWPFGQELEPLNAGLISFQVMTRIGFKSNGSSS
jgi:hypothetical protein